MNAYIIGCEIEPVEENATYLLADFPLHCTLVHWFISSHPASTIIQTITPMLEQLPALRLTATEPALFGLNHDIPVHRIEKTAALRRVHNDVVKSLSALNVTYTIPFIGNAYEPHVTTTDTTMFPPGTSHLATHVYLAQASHHKDRDERTVLKLYTLSQKVSTTNT